MKTIKHMTLLYALSAFAASAWATDYTQSVSVGGTTRTLNDGDTISLINGGNALNVYNSGHVNVSSESDKIEINLGSKDNYVSSVGRGIHVENNSSVTLGSGTIIKGYNDPTNPDAHIIYGINLTTNSEFKVVDSLNIEITGWSRGVGVSRSIADLGTNANIKVDGDIAIMGLHGSQITATNGRFEATGNHSTAAGLYVVGYYSDMADAYFKNCEFIANIGLSYANAAFEESNGQTGITTIDGGKIIAKEQAIQRRSNSDASYNGNQVVNILNGAVVESGSNVLFENSESLSDKDGTFRVNVDGANTSAEGRFLDSQNHGTTTLSISDSATWSSTGASNMDNLILSDANVEFNMTSTTDRITTGNLTLEGDNTVLVGLTNDFLQEVVDLGLPQEFDIGIVKAFQDGDGNISYILATSNDSGSTWDIEDLGGGWFRIDNINIVPEPSTYAAVFGSLAIAFAAYRKRRK